VEREVVKLPTGKRAGGNSGTASFVSGRRILTRRRSRRAIHPWYSNYRIGPFDQGIILDRVFKTRRYSCTRRHISIARLRNDNFGCAGRRAIVRALMVRGHNGSFDVSGRAFLLFRRRLLAARAWLARRRAFGNVFAGKILADADGHARVWRRGPR